MEGAGDMHAQAKALTALGRLHDRRNYPEGVVGLTGRPLYFKGRASSNSPRPRHQVERWFGLRSEHFPGDVAEVKRGGCRSVRAMQSTP